MLHSHPPPNTNTTTILPNCAQYLFISNPPLSNIEYYRNKVPFLKLTFLCCSLAGESSDPKCHKSLIHLSTLLHIGFTSSRSCEIFFGRNFTCGWYSFFKSRIMLSRKVMPVPTIFVGIGCDLLWSSCQQSHSFYVWSSLDSRSDRPL